MGGGVQSGPGKRAGPLRAVAIGQLVGKCFYLSISIYLYFSILMTSGVLLEQAILNPLLILSGGMRWEATRAQVLLRYDRDLAKFSLPLLTVVSVMVGIRASYICLLWFSICCLPDTVSKWSRFYLPVGVVGFTCFQNATSIIFFF